MSKSTNIKQIIPILFNILITLKVIVMGDSLSDNKNLATITNGRSSQYLGLSFQLRKLIDLYIHQIPPSNVYCKNRFSDGYNYLDYISKTYNIELLNYAVGGSSLHPYKRFLSDLSKSLMNQFETLADDVRTGVVQIQPSDVVFIMAGGNDLTVYHKDANPRTMVETIYTIINKVKELGYSQIHIGNVPYFKYVPLVQPKLGYLSIPNLLAKVDEYNSALHDIITINNSIHETSNQIRIFDINSFTRVIGKEMEERHVNSIPCYFGRVTSYTGYFNTKHRIRNDAEEIEYYNGIKNLLVGNHTITINKFRKKFLNSRCPVHTMENYTFFDYMHPMSYVHRRMAIMFDSFLRSSNVEMPEQRDIIDVKTCNDVDLEDDLNWD